MSTTEKILVAMDGPVTTITLNRPEKLNALDLDMLAGLEDAVARIDDDTACRVVVLAAAGERAFCAGADIGAWSALEPIDMWRVWVRRGHRIFDRLAGLRQPVIAAIEGIAFGGGLELAMACDLRVASETAAFALPEVTIATMPGWGGTRRLPALVGPARAKQMIFTGARIDAATAERWGLVNACVAPAELAAEARAMADAIAANAPLSVQTAKQAIDAGGGAVIEALADVVCANTADAAEGTAALKARRPADFKGK